MCPAGGGCEGQVTSHKGAPKRDSLARPGPLGFSGWVCPKCSKPNRGGLKTSYPTSHQDSALVPRTRFLVPHQPPTLSLSAQANPLCPSYPLPYSQRPQPPPRERAGQTSPQPAPRPPVCLWPGVVFTRVCPMIPPAYETPQRPPPPLKAAFAHASDKAHRIVRETVFVEIRFSKYLRANL